MFHQNVMGQLGNIFSGKPKDLTKTSQGTSGSLEAENALKWGLGPAGYRGMMDPTAYGGNVPGAQGPNAAQTNQYNMLTGMQTGYGAPGGYQNMYQNISGMSPQQIQAMSRSGGPAGGYMSPYQDKMIEGANRDMQTAMQMAGNTESDLAQQYSSGGPSSARSLNESYGAMGDIGLKYSDMKNKIRDTGFRNAMGWQREDARDRATDINSMNLANTMFGAMNMNAAQGDINNQMNMSNAFGNYGLNQQNKENIARNFGYGEFNRFQNWKPNMMNNYMAGVMGGPWQNQTTSTQQGQGKSDLWNIGGAMLGLGGAALGGGYFNA